MNSPVSWARIMSQRVALGTLYHCLLPAPGQKSQFIHPILDIRKLSPRKVEPPTQSYAAHTASQWQRWISNPRLSGIQTCLLNCNLTLLSRNPVGRALCIDSFIRKLALGGYGGRTKGEGTSKQILRFTGYVSRARPVLGTPNALTRLVPTTLDGSCRY